MTLTCPECEGAVDLTPPLRLSEIIHCPDCSIELELISLEPLALAAAPEIEEDWGE
jgi:alpha-aminoadipate/glutamate carrier protein LysW